MKGGCGAEGEKEQIWDGGEEWCSGGLMFSLEQNRMFRRVSSVTKSTRAKVTVPCAPGHSALGQRPPTSYKLN